MKPNLDLMRELIRPKVRAYEQSNYLAASLLRKPSALIG
jgi:hypothetical protein